MLKKAKTRLLTRVYRAATVTESVPNGRRLSCTSIGSENPTASPLCASSLEDAGEDVLTSARV